MNKRILLSAVVSFLLAFSSVHIPFAAAQGPYSEEMKVYVAGHNALWFLTLRNVNITDQALTSLEPQNGLDSYTISSIKFSGATSDYQVFGKDGYGIIGLPFIPQQGLFLTLSTSNRSSVDGLASKFGAFLQSAFIPFSSSGNNYYFFSPVDFNNVLVPKLFRYVPSSSANGFASLFTQSQFVALQTPLMKLEGVRTSSGFSHNLVLGSAASSVVDSSGRLSLPTLLHSNNTVTASKIANNSSFYVRSLDGFLTSSDRTGFGNNNLNFSGHYSLALGPGAALRPNVTVVSDVPVAVGTRILDTGSVRSGGNLSVTLEVQNAALRGDITNLSINDSWWREYPHLFALVRGNYTTHVASLPPGQSSSVTYVLRVVSSDKADIFIPSTWVSYTYKVGQENFTGHVMLNQAEVRTNDIGPAIAIEAKSSIRSGSPIGSSGAFLVSVRNLGNGPAINLKVLNYTQPSLVQNGGTWRFNVSMPFVSLAEKNITRAFQLQWQTPAGENEKASSNRVVALFSSTAMSIPFSVVSASSQFQVGAKSANITYAFQNSGRANSTGVSALQSLPDGLTCTNASAGSGQCGNNKINVSLHTLGRSSTTATFQLTLTQGRNFVVLPLNVTTKYKGLSLQTYSSPLVIPGGLSVKKSFAPSTLFAGMRARVFVTVTNSGPMNLYNATIASSADSFDTITGLPTETYSQVAAGQSTSFNYTASINPAEAGARFVRAVSANFVLAGTPQTYSVSEGSVSIMKPISVSATTRPESPTEGNTFTATLSLINTSPVAVSQVHLSIPLPAGLSLLNSTNSARLVNGALVIDQPSLAANSTYRTTLSFRASGGLAIDLRKSTLTFQFGDVTIQGAPSNQLVVVNEDTLSRYTLPITLAIFIMIVSVLVIRRKASTTTSPSSPQETPQKQS